MESSTDRAEAAERALEGGAFTEHLEQHAADYFAGLGAARVQFARTQRRRNATVHFFEVSGRGSSRRVVVKVPVGRNQEAGRRRRSRVSNDLRVVPVSNAEERGRLEHAALRRIHEHFASSGDPRFGAIRVLDYLPGSRAILMEFCPDPDLNSLLAGRRPLRTLGPTRVELALRNAGAWLRAFHELPPSVESVERSASRTDLITSLDRLVGYLVAVGLDAAFLDEVSGAVRRVAAEVLPERLPLATSHGDYSPGNVLVGPDGRVTIFDTRAQWTAPIYEDIARFRVALSTSDRTQGWVYRRAEAARHGAEFLEGYFGEASAPLRAIGIFECQALLANWVAAAHQHRIALGPRRVLRASVLALRGRYLRKRLESLLVELAGDG